MSRNIITPIVPQLVDFTWANMVFDKDGTMRHWSSTYKWQVNDELKTITVYTDDDAVGVIPDAYHQYLDALTNKMVLDE